MPLILSIATAHLLSGMSTPSVTSTLENFRPLYDALVQEDPRKFRRAFDLEAATAGARVLRAGGDHE